MNIPDENLMLEMEQAGFISHREKIDKLGLDFRPSELTQAPYFGCLSSRFGL